MPNYATAPHIFLNGFSASQSPFFLIIGNPAAAAAKKAMNNKTHRDLFSSFFLFLFNLLLFSIEK